MCKYTSAARTPASLRRRLAAASAFLVTAFIATTAHGQTIATDPAPLTIAGATYGASAMYSSAYVWRGFVLSSIGCVQPSAWIAARGFTVTSWANVEVPARGAGFTEHDLTVAYDKELAAATLTLGWTNYRFGDVTDGRYSNDFSASLALKAPLSPTLLVSHDPHEGNGSYISLGLEHGFALPGTAIAATATLSAGYNHHQWTDRRGMSDVTGSLSVELPSGAPRLILRPFITYSHGLAAGIFPRKLFGGLSLVAR